MNIQLLPSADSSPTTLAALFTSHPPPSSRGSPSLYLGPASLLELYGRSCTGKSAFLHHYALHCCLPPSLGGEGLRCVLIDCDGRWRAERMAELVDFACRHRARGEGETGADGEEQGRALEQLKREVLERVRVIRAYSPVELMAALKVVERLCEADSRPLPLFTGSRAEAGRREEEAVVAYAYSHNRPLFHTRDEALIADDERPLLSHAPTLSSLPLPPSSPSVRTHSPSPLRSPSPSAAPPTPSLLLIDNIAAFYWTTKPPPTPLSHPHSSPFLPLFTSTLRHLLSSTGLRCVVTKPVLFRGDGEGLDRDWQCKEYMGEGWAGLVRYRLMLRGSGGGGEGEGRVVLCKDEEREGKRCARNTILDQRPFILTPHGLTLL